MHIITATLEVVFCLFFPCDLIYNSGRPVLFPEWLSEVQYKSVKTQCHKCSTEKCLGAEVFIHIKVQKLVMWGLCTGQL